ncbi:c-type cytochrome [Thalassospira lucentensis]|uniref:c-type cytochrome n=1 Tax=Thalassospira lucentensis TaxID=168935 RepID=UPI0020CA4A82|nr:c-type cytochrome [Thalassospira lucentensis]
MKNKGFMAVGAVVGAAIVYSIVTFFGPGTRIDPSVELRPDDLKLVALGKKVYDANCASCHGRSFEGQENWRERDANGLLPAPPHDETGHTWHHPDAVLFALTKYGPSVMAGSDYKSTMPGFDDVLSDEEILASLSYVKSRWPKEIRKRHDEINRSAREQ